MRNCSKSSSSRIRIRIRIRGRSPTLRMSIHLTHAQQVHACTHTFTHTHIHTHAHTQVNTDTHLYTHAHTCAHGKTLAITHISSSPPILPLAKLFRMIEPSIIVQVCGLLISPNWCVTALLLAGRETLTPKGKEARRNKAGSLSK